MNKINQLEQKEATDYTKIEEFIDEFLLKLNVKIDNCEKRCKLDAERLLE